MLLLGGASTYVLAHADSPDPLELQIVMAGCVMVAVTGALMIFSRFTARVVLEPDGVTVRALVGGALMKRQDIRGVREYQRGRGPRLIELVSRHPEAPPLRLPPVWNEDGAFRAWFDSLQQLPLPEARDAGVPATSPPHLKLADLTGGCSRVPARDGCIAQSDITGLFEWPPCRKDLN